MVFIATGGRMVFATGLEGGVWHTSSSRCGEVAFRYMPHSAVFIPCESARLLQTREKGGDESDPPKPGGHVTPIAVLSGIPLSGPMRGRSRPHLSLREGSEQPPGAALKEGTRTYVQAVYGPPLSLNRE